MRECVDSESQGFPRPVPACGLRWDEAAIDAWLDRLADRANYTVSVAPNADQDALAEELRHRARLIARGELGQARKRHRRD